MPKRLAVVASTVLAIASAVTAHAAAPQVTLSASSLSYGAVTWQHTSPAQSVTLTNTGDAPLSIQSFDMSGEPYIPVDFTVTPGPTPCPPSYLTLAPGSSCQVPVTFDPQSGGPRSATLSIWDNAADSPQKFSLSGTGTGAVVMFTPRYLDFGAVKAGTTSAPKTFSAVNAGDAPMAISSIALGPSSQPPPGFAITADGCTGAVLGPGQRCAVSATVTPTQVGITLDQSVEFYDNAGTGHQSYDVPDTGLQATGAGPLAGILGAPPRFSVGAGSSSAPTPVDIYDAGTQPLQISSIGLDYPTVGFTISHDACSGTTIGLNPPFTSPPPSCEIDVVFTAPGTGSFTSNLVVNDNELGGSHSFSLSGAGYAPAAVLSTTAIDFGFQPVGAASPGTTVTVTNPTGQPLTIYSVTLGGSNPGAFLLSSDSCSGATVAPSGSCALVVAIDPPFPYLFFATLSINDDVGLNVPHSVSLRGEGAAPEFNVSTSLLDFGNQKVNVASTSQTVTVTNTSSGMLSIGLLPGAPLSGSGCTTPLSVGQSCTVLVVITPNSLGAQSALFKVFDSSNFQQQAIEVDWSGNTGAAYIEGSLSAGSFVQTAGTSLALQGFIRNGGTATLTIGQIYLSNPSPAAITTDNCSAQTVQPGQNCALTVTAAPTSPGSWYTTLTVPTDSVGTPNPATLYLRGLVGPPPQPVFLPSSVSFPADVVGSAEATQIVWLDNGLVAGGGAQPISIDSVSIAGSDSSSFRVVWDGCSSLSIDSAFSCPVEVGFDPTAGRALSATLLFSDDASGSPQAVPLAGQGLAAKATLSAQQVDFGAVVVNSKSAPYTLLVTSTGNITLTFGKVTLSGAAKGDYTITSQTCQNAKLAPGAQCQVVLVLRPQAIGPRTATLTFNDNAADSPQLVSLSGSGISK